MKFAKRLTIGLQEIWNDRYQRVLQGEKFEIEELYYINREKIYILNQLCPIFDNFKNVKGILIFSSDITPRKIAEEAIHNSEKKLRELNATKDKFFNIIAHDLKSPFHTLIGFSELLKSQFGVLPNHEITEIIDILYTSAHQGFSLLINLLEWARAQTGKINYTPQPTDLKQLISENIKLIENAAIKKQIEIENHFQKSVTICTDANLVNTILRNLLSNAIKFTYRQGKVYVRAVYQPENIGISISDTGTGIEPENIDKLFRLEADHTTRGTDEEKGTGLGLILCKEFVEKCGGKIEVESKPGKGSKFTVWLPKN
jgi:signal transduction histidine kinase